MAKTDKTQQVDDDLNASADTTPVVEETSATDDLNASEDTVTDAEASEDGDTVASADSEDATGPEYVVLKGNHVRHDGEMYRENSIIPVTGVDAQRLLNAGVIGDAAVLRQRALSTKPTVSVTSE